MPKKTPTEVEVVAKPAKKTTKKVAAEVSAAPALKSLSRFATDTLLAPMVTEKTAMLSSSNVMVFRVALSATRVAVKQAFKELYGVTPVKVNVITVRPRAMHFGKSNGHLKSFKKAMISLPAGTTIDVFASVV